MISTANYAGTAPGEKLLNVLSALTRQDLKSIIGPEVVELVGDTRTESKLAETVVSILKQDPRQLADRSLSQLLFRNLPHEKKVEFEQRASLAGIPPADDVGRARQLAAFLGAPIDDDQSLERTEPSSSVRPEFGLFEHQRSVVRRTERRLSGGHGRTLIHMPTGSGKTRTAMHFVAQTLLKNEPCLVLWLASGRELLEQASEAFAKAWSVLGNREVGNYRFWGNHQPDVDAINDGLLVAGFQKMHHWRTTHDLMAMRLASRTHLVVVDEAHQAIAPSYRAVIEGLAEAGQHNALLGLTATPGRTWNDLGADEQLAEFFHESKVVLEVKGCDNPVEHLIAEGYLAKPTFRRIEYSTAEDSSELTLGQDDFDEDELERLAVDKDRNLAILSAVRELVDRGHSRIILFGASVKHADLLSRALNIEGIESAIVTGETPSAQRRRTIEKYKKRSANPIVLCNFGVLTTGFDAPATSAAIIARPTRSLVLFSQMVGRATRGLKAGGNEKSEVLTVHDPSCPGFGDIAEAFFNWEDVWSE
ncbi:DEAD/DEAH box helicase [Erythrobacter litoralis]|uniref:DEAD/DEAH box helicase n=1 Tax=Erythrobacter litoralis TaxID=39960 RepID=UPI00243594F9|nr:DEAD/DEAH box helicase [Erythrobacter litoralis]MDG6079024.1 DEAD/DEAH box helicase [Erythrobacter litoralis]